MQYFQVQMIQMLGPRPTGLNYRKDPASKWAPPPQKKGSHISSDKTRTSQTAGLNVWCLKYLDKFHIW